jgi:hypothetical protein
MDEFVMSVGYFAIGAGVFWLWLKDRALKIEARQRDEKALEDAYHRQRERRERERQLKNR